MNGLDPNIPLAAGRQPFDPMKTMGEAYQLAGAMDEQRQRAQQQQDQQLIQQALQGGANLTTPEGIAKTAEQLKGRVSAGAYEKMISAQQEMTANETNRQISMSKMSEVQLALMSKRNEAIQQQLQGGLAQYQKDVSQFGEQEAQRRYGEYKKQLMPQLSQQQLAPGQPMFPPQLLQQYSSSNANQDMAALEGVDYEQKHLKAAQDLQFEKAKTAEAWAAAQEKEQKAKWQKTGGAVGPGGQKAPPGYRYTEEGNLEVIPGGPAQIKQQEQRDKLDKFVSSTESNMDRLAQAADEVLKHPGLSGITGVRGKVPNIPGGQAADAQALLDTLKSQVGLGVLQEMRQSSPTGGALGAVSDYENKILQANIAALDRSQSLPQFRANLQKIIDYSKRVKQRLKDARDKDVKFFEGGAEPTGQSPTGTSAGKPGGKGYSHLWGG